MSSSYFSRLWRRQFPGAWHSLFAIIVCLGLLVAGAVTGMHLAQRPGAQSISTFTWALVPFFWWLLIARHSCNLACNMAALRLPGIPLLLTETLATHLLLTVMLPLLVLGTLDPQVDLLQLGGALVLGCALAFLTLCLPSIVSAPSLLGSIYLLGQTQWLANAWAYWLTCAITLALTIALWRWRWRNPAMNTGWLMPLAQMLSLTDLQERPKYHEPSRPFSLSFWGRITPRAPLSAPLAEVLGPRLKTLGQLYGWRGQALAYLLLAAAITLLLVLEPDGPLRTAIVLVGPILMLRSAHEPASWLAGTPERHGGQALHAELLLLPGLPSPELLLSQVCRQITRGLANKLNWLALTILSMTVVHGFPGIWVLWFALWTVMMLPTSLLMTLLAWADTPSRWQTGLMLSLQGLGVLTSILLYRCDPGWTVWLLAGWCVMGVLLLLAAWWAYHHMQQRGAA